VPDARTHRATCQENELYACYFNAKNHVEGETLTRSVQGISLYEKWLAMNDPEKLVAFMQKSTTAKQVRVGVVWLRARKREF
jgi:hypothetical protein